MEPGFRSGHVSSYACLMSRERDFIELLKPLARHPAARGLTDDAAVRGRGKAASVLTHDMVV